MRFDQIVGMTVNRLIGRLLRRLLVALAVAVFALTALYHFEASGILKLEARYGAINAHLIVGGAFVLAALIGVAIWWAMGRRGNSVKSPSISTGTPNAQLLMLVEAVMLGYALARRGDRAR